MRFWRKFKLKYITKLLQTVKISETRDITTPELEACPYCLSKDIVKRGTRQKKYEKAQLYLCNKCQRTFTGQKVKGKSFPLRVIFEGLKLFSPQQVIQTVHLYHRQVYDFSVHQAKLALVLQEYKHGKFENLREFLEAIQSECPHQFF